MVLLAAAVTTRSGKPILSRQFIEMQKARIEGLLAAFPKLMSSGKQHTFVETESVRYVYHPLDQLYVLLITTKTSNILEDLDTLRLFTRVVPEYCVSLTEADVFDNAFSLIFAFDEIVALGYKESVNLSQVRTFVEMDSHEEKVYQAVRQTQEREAKQKMREKAKELQRQKYESQKRGGGRGPYSGSGIGSSMSPQIGDVASSGGSGGFADSGSSLRKPASSASYQPAPARAGPSKALKLGKKSRDVDSFVDQLKSEGQQVPGDTVSAVVPGGGSSSGGRQAAPPSDCPVTLLISEKLRLAAHRAGGLQSLELHGQATLRVTDSEFAQIQLHLSAGTQQQTDIQLQTHPQLDKQAFRDNNVLKLKNPDKPFPINTDVGVLRWRYQTQDESAIPLTINCWPSENTVDNGCDVNIEYTLENKSLSLTDVTIQVPLVRGVGDPVVVECDGVYTHDSRRSTLLWNIALVDSDNPTGSMEFSCGGRPADFFPVSVTFSCEQTLANIGVTSVTQLDSGEPVKYDASTSLQPEKYEVV